MNWEKKRDTNYRHTAVTMYEKDGYRIWKGKRWIISIIYSANKWHLERLSDHKVIWSDKTAKACMENFDNAIRFAEIK